MKKFCFNCLKYPMIFLLIVSSAITIYTNHKGYQFDPIREIQRLKSQNRREDALDLAKFYRENQTEDPKKFAKIEKSLAYTPSEKIKSFAWNGAIMGEVYDSYSGMGAISADLCVIGDLRVSEPRAGNIYQVLRILMDWSRFYQRPALVFRAHPFSMAPTLLPKIQLNI